MKNRIKEFMYGCIFLILVFIISNHLLNQIKAEDNQYTEGYFIYVDKGNYVAIHSYFGTEKDIVVPAALGGKPVAEIEDYAFIRDSNNAENIQIPETVIIVGKNAYSGLSHLKSVTTVNNNKNGNNNENGNNNQNQNQTDDIVNKETNNNSNNQNNSQQENISGNNNTDNKNIDSNSENTYSNFFSDENKDINEHLDSDDKEDSEEKIDYDGNMDEPASDNQKNKKIDNQNDDNKKSKKISVLIIALVISVCMIATLIIAVVIYRNKKRKKKINE